MSDDLDDPVWARVAAARPLPPFELAAAIDARLPVRARPRAAIAFAAVTAFASIAVAIVLARQPERRGPPVVGVAPRDAAPSVDAGGVADWHDLPALIAAIHDAHADAMVRCAPAIADSFHIDAWREGERVAVGPEWETFGTGIYAGDGDDQRRACRMTVLDSLALPPLPPGVRGVGLDVPIGAHGLRDMRDFGAWRDVGRTADALLAPYDDELAGCRPPLGVVEVVVDGSGGVRARDHGEPFEHCVDRVLVDATASLPSPLRRVDLERRLASVRVDPELLARHLAELVSYHEPFDTTRWLRAPVVTSMCGKLRTVDAAGLGELAACIAKLPDLRGGEIETVKRTTIDGALAWVAPGDREGARAALAGLVRDHALVAVEHTTRGFDRPGRGYVQDVIFAIDDHGNVDAVLGGLRARRND